jgi:D-alanyl-D-alanine carboxypeptidase/D-alanyl-D-alanine-endopeptidase (penicillin-binding protein 4)
MKRFVVVGAIVLGVFSLANLMRAQDLSAAYTLPQLQAQIAAQLAQPRFAGALWGVKVVALDSGQTIFAEHADRLMTPASNTKLYTAALGLDQLGGDYRFETPVYAFGKIGRNGTLRGDLCVVGQGDPSWNQRRLGTNFWAIFEPFVRVIIQAGVRRVNGDLLADTTFFHGPPTGAGWQIDDLRAGNVGLLSALSLNDNLAQVRVEPGAQPGWPCQVTLLQPGTGLVLSNLTTTVARNLTPHIELFPVPETSVIDVLGQLPVNADRGVLDVAVPRPADWFAAGLKLALARSGVLVTGRVRVFSWPETPGRDARATTKLGTVSSPPLREVVAGFMKPSQNLETDLLLAAVGEKLRPADAPAWESSAASGLIALTNFLAKAGVPAAEVSFNEGSGLSRDNLTTASATVALLQFMAKHREAEAFLASLPVAGVDGTLKGRLRGPATAGNVRAKTGTLHWASALSGYVTTAGGERWAFCFMLNRFTPAPGHLTGEELDSLAVLLAKFAGHPEKL